MGATHSVSGSKQKLSSLVVIIEGVHTSTGGTSSYFATLTSTSGTPSRMVSRGEKATISMAPDGSVSIYVSQSTVEPSTGASSARVVGTLRLSYRYLRNYFPRGAYKHWFTLRIPGYPGSGPSSSTGLPPQRSQRPAVASGSSNSSLSYEADAPASQYSVALDDLDVYSPKICLTMYGTLFQAMYGRESVCSVKSLKRLTSSSSVYDENEIPAVFVPEVDDLMESCKQQNTYIEILLEEITRLNAKKTMHGVSSASLAEKKSIKGIYVDGDA